MAYRPMHRRNEYFQILEKVKNHIYVLLPYNYLEAYPENEELYKEYKYLAERMNLRVIDKYAIKSWKKEKIYMFDNIFSAYRLNYEVLIKL